MRNNKISLIIILLIISSLSPIIAQQSIVSTGGDFIGTGGSMSYSTGLSDYYFYQSGTGSLQFGIQHAFFDGTPGEIPHELDVPNTNLAGGETDCFNALLTITTGGDGTTFIVEDGAMAELIAGNNIRMLDGTRVVAGGYLHARITTDGTFCDTDKLETMAPLAEIKPEKSADDILLDTNGPLNNMNNTTLFKVYPNPTTGSFTLELTRNDILPMGEINVEVFGLRGERIMSEKVVANQPRVFSLKDRQPGIYIIRVVGEDLFGVERIIKR